MALDAKYSGVIVRPASIMTAPLTPRTRGTDNAAKPREARWGHGLASIRGMVGISNTPKGQNSHEDGKSPSAYRAMVKSGTGIKWPLRTP